METTKFMETTNSPTATGGQDETLPVMPKEPAAADAPPAPDTPAQAGTPAGQPDQQAADTHTVQDTPQTADTPTVQDTPQTPTVQETTVGTSPVPPQTSLPQPIPSAGPAWSLPDPAPFADPGFLGDPTSMPAAQPRFTLRRSKTDRMLGGVCGGLAESLDVDPALLRIGLVVLTILGFGLGAVVYIAAWILAPQVD